MLMTSFTYVKFSLKRFHCMIQVCSENVIFLMLYNLTLLIKASMAYCVNIVRSLLNLLNLSTLPYFVFLEIQVLNFWYLFRNLRILLVFPFLIFSLHFRIFLILRFLMAEFHGIYYVPASRQDFPYTLLSDVQFSTYF